MVLSHDTPFLRGITEEVFCFVMGCVAKLYGGNSCLLSLESISSPFLPLSACFVKSLRNFTFGVSAIFHLGTKGGGWHRGGLAWAWCILCAFIFVDEHFVHCLLNNAIPKKASRSSLHSFPAEVRPADCDRSFVSGYRTVWSAGTCMACC